MKEWWRKSVVYQIYPKSFKDTTGNGLGDIRGIIEKLDYLKFLGVDILWITPMYLSPQNDNGYDIADYYQIDPIYGTMEDFDELLQEAHNRNLKIMMDVVINHTSTDHPWFKEAIKDKTSKYRDYYIWRKGYDSLPPNNWDSKFGGSAWQYDEKSGEYYLHLFDVSQADLNWENEELRAELQKMMKWWLDRGVDSMRLDVINLISKCQEFKSDFEGPIGQRGKKYYTDGPRIHEFLKEVNENVFSNYPMVTVGEMSSTSIDNCIQYTNPESKELSMVFSFHHLKVDYNDGEKWELMDFDLKELKRILSKWQIKMNQGNGWNALFWCNHDQPRVTSRFGDEGRYREESSKMLATAIHFLKGTPYIYQGEEIGMLNPNFNDIEKYRDIETKNIYKILEKKGLNHNDIMNVVKARSRDDSRTPMQWNYSENAGFSSANPWIEIPDNYKDINVEQCINDTKSILYHYKKLISLRKELDIITYGDYEALNLENDDIFMYTRALKNERLLIINNFRGKSVQAEIPECFKKMDGEVIISNYHDSKSNMEISELRPYESIVYHFKK